MTPSQTQPADGESKKREHTAALSVGLVCLLIGLPLWWKTTEVYRVSLPYSDMERLSNIQVKYSVDVEVIWSAGDVTEEFLLTDLALHLGRRLDSHTHQAETAPSPHYTLAVRDADKQEVAAVAEVTSESDLHTIMSSENLNKYKVVMVSPSRVFSHPVLASGSTIFLPYNGAGVDGLSAQIAKLLKDVVRQGAVAKHLESAQGQRMLRPDKEMMRSFGFHSGYDLTFTLIVPEPDKLQVQWDFVAAQRDYLQPLIDSVSDYTQLIVRSQVLYFARLGGRPKKEQDLSFYYREQDLPHVINPLETKLGSDTSNNPSLNFVVYIPPREVSPLYMLDLDGEKVSSNSFLSPRWGGVMIYNTAVPETRNLTSEKSAQAMAPVNIDMHTVMEPFVSQIKRLLSMEVQIAPKELQVLGTGSSALRQWELAGWLRCRCVENLATASATLKSLAQLLEEIGNIVINEEIGKEVEAAVSAIQSCHSQLASGHLMDAFKSSRSAVQASELAFFHPSLLELLYFPEDQKFAIYIPLFLPVSIPVISSMLQAVRWLRQKRRIKQD